MEFEKMCDLDNQGYYTMLFPNKHNLQMAEIIAFFSQFEGFHDVRAAGTEGGHRFPRFKTLEGARQAFDALTDHPTICLKPYINRKKNSNQENRPKENGGSNGSDNVFNSKNRDNEKSANLTNGKTIENNVSSISMRLMKYRRDPAQVSDEETNSADLSLKPEETNSSEKNLMHEESNSVEIQIIHNKENERFNGINENDIDIDSSICTVNKVNVVNKLDNGFCEGSKYEESEEIDDVEVPGLMIRAGEVVVGNMHPSYGPAYMLHLFNKYEPLAVSTIQSVTNRRTKYCHVYFKTPADASEVEKQFDKFVLMGQKLLVMQPKTLMGFKLC